MNIRPEPTVLRWWSRWAFVPLGFLSLVACNSRSYRSALNTPEPTVADLARARTMDDIERMLQLGDYRQAQRRLEQELANGYRHPRAFHLQGRILRAQGGEVALAKAVECFDQASRQSPSWLDPRLELAETYLKQERFDSADAVFGEVDRLHPQHPAGPYGRAMVALQAGRQEEAAKFLAESLKRNPAFPPALRASAYLARQKNDQEAERNLLERYLLRRPMDAAAHLDLGGIYEGQNRLEDARRAYERCYELQPAPHVARRLATLATRQKDDRAAETWSRRAE